jgi:DNA-binding NtrC family response regulator
MARILVIDDEQTIRDSLAAALSRRGHQVGTAASFAEGARLTDDGYDVILLDVRLPDGNGLDLLKAILARDSRQIVVMISGHADIDTAVEAIRSGAWDFIEKPLSLDRVLITIDNARRTTSLISEKDRLTRQVYGEFIGESPTVIALKNAVLRSAPRATRFLITGENGTGKELIAHMVHRYSRFAEGPFVAVNCAALPTELIEAELFGHTAGAFTGARKSRNGLFVHASGGSIFLDEIGDMPPAAQAKILRVIESQTVTPVGADSPVHTTGNVIAATNRNLEQLITQGAFRQDLLYRLNVVQFDLPPLRERPEDIPLLARHFLARFAAETKSPPRLLTEPALRRLRRHQFPGNTRELKNLMERINIHATTSRIEADIIDRLMPDNPAAAPITLKDALDNCERDFIKTAIARNSGNMTDTARELGIERSHLYKKIRKLGLNTES